MAGDCKFKKSTNCLLYAAQAALGAVVLIAASIAPASRHHRLVIPLKSDAQQESVTALLSNREIFPVARGPIDGSLIMHFKKPPGIAASLDTLISDNILIIPAQSAGCATQKSLTSDA